MLLTTSTTLQSALLHASTGTSCVTSSMADDYTVAVSAKMITGKTCNDHRGDSLKAASNTVAFLTASTLPYPTLPCPALSLQLLRGGPAASTVEVSATCSSTDCQKVYIKLVNYNDKRANVSHQLDMVTWATSLWLHCTV
jgi:hypothetical protein